MSENNKRPSAIREHLGLLSIAVAIVTVGLGWLAATQITGKEPRIYLTRTHLWDATRISIYWKVRCTGLVTANEETVCLVSGQVTNRDSLSVVAVTSVSLILKDRWGFDLEEGVHTLNWDGERSVYAYHQDPLQPKESRDFTFRVSVPSALVADISDLGATLAFRRPED